MAQITKRFRVDAPAAAFWEQLFDYDAPPPPFAKGARTEILEPGSPDPKGLGCVRSVHGGSGPPMVERIVAWDPPRSFSYSVISGPMPTRTYEGTMTLVPDGDGTVVEYKAEFEPRIWGTAWLIKLFFDLLERFLLRKFFNWMAQLATERDAAES